MPRKLSTIAPDWWDYTTLDDALIEEAASLTPAAMAGLSRDGFKIVFYDTLEDFYLAEALEYITGHSDVWVTTGREIAKYYIDNYYDKAVADIAAKNS